MPPGCLVGHGLERRRSDSRHQTGASRILAGMCRSGSPNTVIELAAGATVACGLWLTGNASRDPATSIDNSDGSFHAGLDPEVDVVAFCEGFVASASGRPRQPAERLVTAGMS